MLVSFWIVRGINNPLKQFKVLRRLVTLEADVVCLLETRIRRINAGKFISSFSNDWNMVGNYESIEGGRIWILWKKQWSFIVLRVSDQSLTIAGSVNGHRTLITIVYGSNSRTVRRGLWDQLKYLEREVGSAPWVVEGDFNAILRAEESSDFETLSIYNSPGMKDFQGCLEDLDLLDHPFLGPLFTWTNKHDEGFLARKLDRILVNPGWLFVFPDSFAEFKAQDFLNIVKESWLEHCNGNPLQRLFTKMKRLKPKLKDLNNEQYSDISKRVLCKRAELERIQLRNLSHADLRNIDEERTVHAELADLEVAESDFYRKRANVHWLKECDLKTRCPSVADLRGLLNFSLAAGAEDMLTREVDDKEIKDALFRQGNGKSPGPDGYSSWFFKAAWEVVGSDFLAAVSQTTFVKGRNIVDNTLLAQEIVKGYSRKSLSPRCAIKIDLLKAFDYVNWEFFMVVLEAIGLPLKFCSWIKVCATSTKFSVSLNGSLVGYFNGARGVRQGDPLSLYLFVLVMNVLSSLLDVSAKNGIFKYHPKCKRISLTHLCFADDLLVLCYGSMDSVMGVLSTLEAFYKLSGLRLNVQKIEIYACGLSELFLSKFRQLILPKGVIRDVEKLCMRFFWKGCDSPARGARERALSGTLGVNFYCLRSVDFWNAEYKAHFS
ncbi:uncharacterized protein LOC120158443 [Hibiscus syriacus]|uniref:uncharacterized protein LOC120158443 n=1 Tax=Hibiscus syriacus TaxID=106335 RepID=UPI00192348FE|nr:uncharacterized protein LOC120158443 [Hibiscus syriacus]